MDYKDILQKLEDREKANKDSVYVCWKVPSWKKDTKNTEKYKLISMRREKSIANRKQNTD